jgi:soluble lytic murein transglycosylase-like protein
MATIAVRKALTRRLRRFGSFLMKRSWLLVFAAVAALPCSQAQAQRADYEAMVARHARANAVPELLVHRVIVRESRYQPQLVGRGGTIGLMQIKLATARGLGYGGDAEGLRDPDTNLAYGVKYLAGAYHAAGGDHARAIHYFAAGYYEAAKRQRLETVRYAGIDGAGNPLPAPSAAAPKRASNTLGEARAELVPAARRSAQLRHPR